MTAESTASQSPSRPLYYASAGLFLAVLIAYGPTLSSDFVRLDDPQYVVNNALVRNPSLSGAVRFFREVRKPSTVAGYYQPLTMISLMIDGLITGHGEVSPAVCHFTNILLHATTCVLLMFLLRDAVGGIAIPFILALVYAVHPANVESVAWISQRKTVLATPLAVSCLLCYLRYGRTGRWILLWASVAFYLLANLAKPTVVLLPLVLPLLDIWPLRRRVVPTLLEKWPFVVIMALMGYVAMVSQASSIATLGVPNFGSADVLGKWFALLAYNLTLYLGDVFWPLYLAPFRAVPDSLSFSNTPILLSCLLILFLIAVWLVSRRRYPPLFVGLAAFAITLLPALGPVRFFDSCVSDRFLYFPLIFLLLAGAAVISDIEGLSERRTPVLRYAICLLMVPLLILMRAHQRIWRDSLTFWTHVADSVPDYGIAHVMLGICYFDAQMFDEAEQHAQKGYELRPGDGDAVSVLGRVKIERGHPADAAAFLRAALAKSGTSDSEKARLALAEALTVTGDLPGASAAVARAIELGAEPGRAYERVGDTAMQKAKRFEFAAWAYRAAIKEQPGLLTARWNLGTCLEAMGDDGGALKEYEEALRQYEKVGRPNDALRGSVQRLRMKLQDLAASRPSDRSTGRP